MLEEGPKTYADTTKEEEEIQWQGKSTTLNFNSTIGITFKHSFKLWGELNRVKMLVLIDYRASHNFISELLVQKLQFSVKKKTILGEGLPVTKNFYLFLLNRDDVVLGMEWLRKLGPIKADFE
ncbi:hypothetical protein CR513_20808, partial [Mucuna pruriens]